MPRFGYCLVKEYFIYGNLNFDLFLCLYPELVICLNRLFTMKYIELHNRIRLMISNYQGVIIQSFKVYPTIYINYAIFYQMNYQMTEILFVSISLSDCFSRRN